MSTMGTVGVVSDVDGVDRVDGVDGVDGIDGIDGVDEFAVGRGRLDTAGGAAAMTLLGSWSLSLGGRPAVLPSSAQRLLVLLALEGRRQPRKLSCRDVVARSGR